MPKQNALSRRQFLQATASLATASTLPVIDGDNPACAAIAAPDAVERPLRYCPEGTDFVIKNGPESFNRPLYSGRHTAFRIDAGDRPEFSLYVPGRGGVLRLGLKSSKGVARWLFDAKTVKASYRPGSMVYEIRDPELLSGGSLTVTVLPMCTAEGLVLCVERTGTANPVELIWGYGGADGGRGSRGGDIGAEKEPVSQFFRLTPERCAGNRFTLENGEVTLESRVGMLRLLMPEESEARLADASRWEEPVTLLAAQETSPAASVLVGTVAVSSNAPLYLGVQLMADRKKDGALNILAPALSYADLPDAFDRAEKRRQNVVARVAVETPDPYINAAAAALCVAADGVWDDTGGVYMHGAVAWRSPLAGWRGQYTGDAQGQHDRTRRHLRRFAAQQNLSPIPTETPGADAKTNLSRSEDALHSNGNLTSNHYDMNLICIDALFRHLLWTGDIDFAREMWPVLERHFDWERRLFRRPFGTDGLPLYEAYACIWASDDLQYHGGGVTHASAYNLWHHRMNARLARLLGKDDEAGRSEAESAAISRAMRRELWLSDRGWYAEWKDLIGRQSAHPDAALWTFYHTLDSEAATLMEAWQMSRFVEIQIPQIPVCGPGVPKEGLYTLPTTRWMPYTWSTNNVVMAESAHTALALWQAGRDAAALRLWKGCLLDSMYLGLCPGNAGMTTFYDQARGEAQRDFADAVGTNSRTLIEGLFGVRPDALSGKLTLSPGFPDHWEYARLRHPNVTFSFRRTGKTDIYEIESRFSQPMIVRLCVSAQRDRITGISVNDRPGTWRVLPDTVGRPKIEITVPPSSGASTVVIQWAGNVPEKVPETSRIAVSGEDLLVDLKTARLESLADPQRVLSNVRFTDRRLLGAVVGTLGHRTLFAQVRQGDLVWWLPIPLEVRPAFEVFPSLDSRDGFRVRKNAPLKVSVRIKDVAPERRLPGSRWVMLESEAELLAQEIMTDWTQKAAEGTNWECLDLAPHFNDTLTRLFQNEYLSPRSPYCSLALPKQGIGSWCHPDATWEIDDSGLRSAAAKNDGRLVLPQGVPFGIPPQERANNAVFVSQWDNYPDEIVLPVSGSARHLYLLMAGTTNSMQSRFDNGDVLVTYRDGSTSRLALHNPTTWWPIDQDYSIDTFAFRRPEPIPPRVDLKTGLVRLASPAQRKYPGGRIPGGAATVLDLPLDSRRELKSLTIRSLANEVVVGLLAATLVRP